METSWRISLERSSPMNSSSSQEQVDALSPFHEFFYSRVSESLIGSLSTRQADIKLSADELLSASSGCI